MGGPLQESGRILVFGRGDNPINFVSATDVAALVELAVTDPSTQRWPGRPEPHWLWTYST
jgi:hypothetical protein